MRSPPTRCWPGSPPRWPTATTSPPARAKPTSNASGTTWAGWPTTAATTTPCTPPPAATAPSTPTSPGPSRNAGSSGALSISPSPRSPFSTPGSVWARRPHRGWWWSRSTPRTLGPAEQRALLRAAAARGPRAFAMIVLGLDTGPRKSEIPALALTGLDLGDWPGTLAINDSTGNVRTVPLQPGTRAALVAWLAERRRLLRGHPEQVALFLTEYAPHRRLAVRTVDDAIRAVGADAGLDISPGTLRATAEQRMLREGLPPAVVAARLGQQAPDRDRVRALLGGAAARPRNRLPLTGHEQLDLFGDIAI
ncbi:tyrosine-type recombinase/integrase [Nocardia gipuzkoensis]